MLNTPAGSPSMPTSIRVTMPSPSRPLTADSDVTLPSPAAVIALSALAPPSGPNCCDDLLDVHVRHRRRPLHRQLLAQRGEPGRGRAAGPLEDAFQRALADPDQQIVALV